MGIGEGTIVNQGAEIVLDNIEENVIGPMTAPCDLTEGYEGSDIGKNCIIGNNVVIRNDVHIGDNSVIAHQTIIEPNTWIGNATTVQVFSAFASDTKIGDNCFIGPYFSTTNCFVQPVGPKGRHPAKVQGKLESLRIGNDVSIGANVCVIPGIVIGNNVEIGMNTFIKADVPSGESPENPFKIRGGSVWTKKDLFAYNEYKKHIPLVDLK